MVAHTQAGPQPMTAVRTDRLPPLFEGGYPLIGHTIEFVREPVALMRRAQQTLGDVFRFRIVGQEFTVVAGPENHDKYFRAAETQLSAKEVYKFTVPIFGKGIAYDAEPQIMDEQLGFLYPALREDRLRTYIEKMEEETRLFIKSWGAEGELDLYERMNELTTYIASRTLVAEEIRHTASAEFAAAYHDLQAGINAIGFFAPHAPVPSNLRRDRARKQIVKILEKVLNERRQSGRKEEDFMQTLLESRYKDGKALTDHEIIGLLVTGLFAGQHTSAVLGTWAGLELMQHRHVLPPILAELEQLYGKGEQITFDTLKRSLVLERAINEAERMHPPLIMLVRKVLQDIEIGGYLLPKGTLAMVSPALSHTLWRVFRNPESYDPDRFAPPREESKKHPYTLIAFGGGKHRCVGLHFAYLQIKAIWSVLLREYDFELVSKDLKPDYASWVVGPKAPCRVKYRRR